MNEQNILKESLRQFGLNPIEWQLQKQKRNHYLICNKQNANFTFKGVTNVKQNKMNWKLITLESI